MDLIILNEILMITRKKKNTDSTILQYATNLIRDCKYECATLKDDRQKLYKYLDENGLV